MTDLATLRIACQRGEMPTAFTLLTDDAPKALQHAMRETVFGHLYVLGSHLDALAALQEALWPGSVTECLYNQTYKVWISGHGAGDDCPTLATAWLDAILSGLMKE